LTIARPDPRSGPFFVIPAKAGIHVHRNETAEAHPEFSKAAVICLTKPDTTVAGGSPKL
jgi:hypothetical protein